MEKLSSELDRLLKKTNPQMIAENKVKDVLIERLKRKESALLNSLNILRDVLKFQHNYAHFQLAF